MNLQSEWLRVHGSATHFPIALVIASVLFDMAGYFVSREPYRQDLRAAGFYTIVLGAVASLAAVLSGLMMTGWETTGSGLILRHHLYLWPAFALLVVLAVWRLVVGREPARRPFGVYLVLCLVTAVLLSAAGYWGGEMLIGGMR